MWRRRYDQQPLLSEPEAVAASAAASVLAGFSCADSGEYAFVPEISDILSSSVYGTGIPGATWLILHPTGALTAICHLRMQNGSRIVLIADVHMPPIIFCQMLQIFLQS
eukprot:s7563_g1.t1